HIVVCFIFRGEDGIRVFHVTGVQTCALPISYSGFDGTDLDERLRAQNVRRVFVGGLATDYCVLNTVKDARRLGYDVVLLESAVRPVEVRPGDGARAIAEMKELGATVLSEAP